MKKLIFIQILLKLEEKNVDHHLITFRNQAAAFYQSLEEVPGPLLPEKNQKHKKIAKILQN